jgi:hypothetical protein
MPLTEPRGFRAGHTALIGSSPTPAPVSDLVKFLFCIHR